MAENERELSQFLYHVTEEIVASGDFSDCNINRICSKYYENSSFPDRERLCRLVAQLKRKLKIFQTDEYAHSSNNHVQPISTEKLHSASCPRQYNPYPPEAKTTADKCVATTPEPSRSFFPTHLLVSESTQYSEPYSVHTFSTASACNNSTCTACGSCRSANLQETQTAQRSLECSSDDSNALIERVLLIHAPLEGTSSDMLMRLAAGDRVLCESCQGKCPLSQCGHVRSNQYAGSPPPASPDKACGPTCYRPVGFTGNKKKCDCPLKQCAHTEKEDSGGAGTSGSVAPILKQEPPPTPPMTCCGARKKKRSGRPACKPKCDR